MSENTQLLLTPTHIGPLNLKNRVVMAPMTRARVDNPGLVPNALQAEYYQQRAGAGLLITEGTWPNKAGIGYINVPGLFTTEQAAGWKQVTDAVHAKGGLIFAQLGHTGAVSHPDLLDGALPLAPSAINPLQNAYTPSGFKPTVIPKAMTLEEIKQTVADYQQAGRLAKEAGFDGVEVHAAGIYLLPQFFNASLNQRDDQYGGSPENRGRILFEILDALGEVWHPSRLGVKLSPAIHAMGGFTSNADTLPTYQAIISRLSGYGLAYLHLINATADLSNTPVAPLAAGVAKYYRPLYQGTLLAGGGYQQHTAEALLQEGSADLVAFGSPFIANPDLVYRFQQGIELATGDQATFYQGGAEGYIDYPFAAGNPQ